MNNSLYPSLYQINTRVWLTELSRELGRKATLDDISNEHIDRLAEMGFDWIWLLSVWQTGAAGQRVSRAHSGWRAEFERTLPDLKEEDIAGSGFAITSYTVHKDLGGDKALAKLRERLSNRGLKLLLDFVPNHTALDHHWVTEHPEFYISGSESDLANQPQNYIRIERPSGELILAYGRDPYFDGWPDTLQLNYSNPALQAAMVGELQKISAQCDGLRCDMSMLVEPEVFERTWGLQSQQFWINAITTVKNAHQEFRFVAEVYWDMEWQLQQRGFDYTYDKRLYDRLRDAQAKPVCGHLCAELDYQGKMARFLENHDEPRAASTFSPAIHQAAAVISFLSPGLRFFHQGQLEGKKVKISPHLIRGPVEPVNEELQTFYRTLLDVIRKPLLHQGRWQLLQCIPAWNGNESWESFISFLWQGEDEERLMVAVNLAPHHSQCYVKLPIANIADETWRFEDQLGQSIYEREGADLAGRGLYLDMSPWQTHVFDISNKEMKKTTGKPKLSIVS